MADPLPLSDTSGISDEDRRDIAAQIDRVAEQNRIQATPQLFLFKPKKRGFVVPLAVNLGAVVVLAVGVAALWLLFRQGAETQEQNRVVLQSAEGKLLEELKKASASELQAKDQQIADIQKRMDDLARQKSDLQTSMADKIAAREAELRAELQKAVEAERARLAAAGFSQAVIEEKIKAFEKQKNVEFQQQLEEYRAQADKERKGLEANLKKQQDDFQKNLDDLARDRQKLLDESRRKQQELQAQLDQKSRDLANQQSANQAQLATAQQQLNDLNDQRLRSESVQNQLTGLYTKVAQSIQSRQIPEALHQVQALTTFLNDDTVKAIPEIQKRRDGDLYLASTLADWLTQEQRRLDAEAAALNRTVSPEETLRTLASQGAQAVAAGNLPQAEDFYQKALAVLPAALESHQFFLDKALRDEQARQKAFNDTYTLADTEAAAGRAAEAVRLFQQALAYLPLNGAPQTNFFGRYEQSAYESRTTARLAQSDLLLKPGLLAAQAQPTAAAAFAAYVDLLDKYPNGQVGAAALAGLRLAGESLMNDSGRVAGLLAERAKLQADKDQLVLDAKAQGSQQLADLTAAREKIAQLQPLADSLGAMRSGYRAFADQNAPLWSGTPDSSRVLQSKLLLSAFLTSPDMNASFPSFNDSIGRFDKVYQQAGARESLINVGDALGNLGQLDTPQEKKAYVNGLLKRYASDPAMTEVLTKLGALF